jgi:hypothetical protein
MAVDQVAIHAVKSTIQAVLAVAAEPNGSAVCAMWGTHGMVFVKTACGELAQAVGAVVTTMKAAKK